MNKAAHFHYHSELSEASARPAALIHRTQRAAPLAPLRTNLAIYVKILRVQYNELYIRPVSRFAKIYPAHT